MQYYKYMDSILEFLMLCALMILSRSASAAKRTLSMAEVLAASSPADWRPLDPDNTLYVELPAGRVVIELAPHSLRCMWPTSRP